MAVNNTPIYRDVFRLSNMLLDNIENMSVKHRKILGDRIVTSAMNCVSHLHFAYGIQSKRLAHLDRFKAELGLLKTTFG